MKQSHLMRSVRLSKCRTSRYLSVLFFILILSFQAGILNAGTLIPLEQAESTVIPSSGGDGVFCEIFLGIGGGTTPLPAHIETRMPDADLLSPRIDFPHPGGSIGIGSNFQTFFSDTIFAPDAVKNLTIRNFILRGTTLLKITEDLDRDPVAEGINVRIGIGSDDGFYLITGDTYLGGRGDRGFAYSWFDVDFEAEGLYPLYFLFAANSVGYSGLELSWVVASGQAIIPQSNMYQSTVDCDNTVLFDELPAGTYLTDQYAAEGMIVNVLGGDLQVTDVRPSEFVPVSGDMVFADPTVSPVDEGVVDFVFVEPATLRPAVTSYFSCYVIDTETIGATLTAYGPEDEVLDTIQINAGGASQQQVEFAFSNIRRIQVSLGSAEDTSALDNLCWASPSALIMPDLTPIELTPPETAFADHEINVSWVVKNISVDPASGSWTDRIYLSQDNTWDETDTLLGSLQQNGPIDPDQSYTKNLSVTLPDSLNGDYWIIIFTDKDNTVKEYSGESNNTLASAISLVTDHTGAKITSHTPTGLIKIETSYIDVTFDEAINPATFTADDVVMTNSGGDSIAVSDAVDQGGNVFRISFAEQFLPGVYTLVIGPGIEDAAGNLMDQNNNSTPGEEEDVYTATFMLNVGQESTVLMINIHGSSYDSSGYAIYQTLLNAGVNSANSTYLNLSSNGQAASLLAANSYDQVWIFDLSSNSGDNSRFPADWQAIADWFNQDPSRAIVCDGRMISSYWNGRSPDEGQKLTENYYENIKAHNGGIVLGTDHNAFHPGINEINRLINIEPFVGNFSLTRIPVDTASPLMTFPNNMGVDLYDDSSPGQTPFGLQPNGRILYTVAWHSGNHNTPGISTTIEGFVGFHARIESPEPGSSFYVNEEITFTASGINATPPVSYTWTSSINGEFSQEQSVDIATLDPGVHTITLLGEDSAGAADTAVITVTIIDLPDLEISAPSAPDSAYASQAITANWTVTNLRDQVTEGTWTDAVYLSDDDQPGGDVLLTTVERLNQLALNESYVQTIQAAIPGSTVEGAKWLIIKTNNTGSLTETSDENNTSVAIPIGIKLLPIIEPLSDESVIAGIAYTSVAPVLEQGTAPVSWQLAEGPAGVEIDPTTGVVTWASPVARPAPYTITIEAENDGGSDTESMDLLVAAIPAINVISDQTISVDTPYNGPVPTLQTPTSATWSLSKAPAGMTINPTTGVAAWPTPVASPQAYTITIQAENIAGTDTQSWLILVGVIPAVNTANDVTIIKGDDYTSDEMTLSKGSLPVTWTLSGPSGMTINPSTAVISWPNAVLSATPYNVTVTATNAFGDDSTTFALTVVTTPAIDQIDSTIIETGLLYTGPVPHLIIQTVATWSLEEGPAGMTINPTTGVVTWPNPVEAIDSYTVTIRATNIAGSDDETWNLRVTTSPVIGPIDDLEIIAGNAYTSQTPTLLKGTAPVTWYIVESPHFEVSIDSATGIVTWPNPLPWHKPLKFVIAASNSGGTDEETWYLSVLVTPDIESIDDDITASGLPFTSDSPTLTPGTIATWSLIEGPAGMTIDTATGAVSWNDPVKSVDPYPITVRAENIAGQDTASWSLTVMDLPIINPISDEEVTEYTAYTSQTPTLSQGSDTEVTWSLASRPAGMNIDSAAGISTWPNAIPGTTAYTVTVRATNAAGFHERTYLLRVLSSPEISPISDEATAAGVPYAKQPNLVRGTLPITWQLITAPEGVTINSQTGMLTWLDPVESPNAYPITVRAVNNFDGTERSDEISWHLSVQWIPDIEPIADDSIEENMPYSLTPVLLQGTAPVSWVLVKAPGGMTIDNSTGQIDWPNAAAAFEPYEVTVQALNQVGSDDETFLLAVPVTYTATVAADIDTAPARTSVTLSGQATWLEDGTAAPDVDVSIRLRVQGTRRIIMAHTDSEGNFSKVFTPLASEAGLYTISADHPAIPTDTVQDTFILLGMRTEPVGVRHQMFVGQTVNASVVLRNFGDVPITGLAAVIENAPANLNINLVDLPDTLAPLSVVTLNYTIEALDSNVPESMTDILLTGDGGAQTLLQLAVRVVSPLPDIKTSISHIETGMTRGKQIFIEFDITNDGGAATAQLDVLLPNADWMSLVSSETIPPLEPQETSTVIIALSPSDDPVTPTPLGVHEGSIVVAGVQTGATVTYSLNCVSESKGDLMVIAEDELTYLADNAPYVQNATVIISDPGNGEILETGVTDENGIMTFSNLTEAWYDVVVQADEHGSFGTTILVEAGKVTQLQAFLPGEYVTYKWTVEPTVVDDHYIFTIEAVFETNVPVPIVTVEPAFVDLENMTGETMQLDYTITNHGLITAEDTDIVFGSNSRYEFTPLADEIGSIPAKTSLTVPVLIRDLEYGSSASAKSVKDKASSSINKGLDCTVSLKSFVGYRYECGPNNRYHEVPFYFKLPVITCTGGGTSGYWDPYSGWGGGWGDWGSGGGWGGVWGGGGGWSPDIPVMTHSTFDIEQSCDPCQDKRNLVLLKCIIDFLPISCPATIIKSTAECAYSCSTGSAWDCARTCIGGVVGSVASCGKNLTPIGWIWTGANCIYDLATACDDLPSAASYDEIQLTKSRLEKMTGHPVDLDDENVDFAIAYAQEHADRLRAMSMPIVDILGDPIWLSGDQTEEETIIFGEFLEKFGLVTAESSEESSRISVSEQNELLAMTWPNQINVDDVNRLVERWNRTMDYWQAGIENIEDVPQGQSTEFIDYAAFVNSLTEADAARELNEAEGFADLFGGFNYASQTLQKELEKPTSGVCARVKIQIQQKAVISRNAFKATLELGNEGDTSPLEQVNVVIEIRDADGNVSTDLFGIHPPELTNIDSIINGTLPAGQTGISTWIIVPTSEAAPLEAKQYFVRGTLSYVLNGSEVTVPLYPAPITVLPDPRLVVDYFLERDVYSDDPFTPDVVEPAIPFSLGLRMTNIGAGEAMNVRITSSQPEIIENEKGLLINFQIIGTRIGTQEVSPSLTVNLGDIAPDSAVVVQWLMTASLQGEFIEYHASYEHVDGLGDPRLSLIDSVDIHETEHVVYAENPGDNLPDFLTNEIPDIDDLPDRVFLSDGSNEPVGVVTEASVSDPVTLDTLEIELAIPQMPDGWSYVRIPDPGDNEFDLVAVTRSGAAVIRIPDNAWLTHKIVREEGNDPYELNRLHIFDLGVGLPETYTLTYASFDKQIPVAANFSAEDITESGADAQTFTVTYSDDVAIRILSLSSNNIRVTGPGGFDQLAKFVNADSLGDGTPRVATYRINAPDGEFTDDNNGTYSIFIEPDQVEDTSYNSVASGLLGTFAVDLPITCRIELDSYVLLEKRRVGRTIYEYNYAVKLTNPCVEPIANIRFQITSTPGNIELLSEDVFAYDVQPDSTEVATGYITIRIDHSTEPDISAMTWRTISYVPGDVTHDGKVDMDDVVKLATFWLTNERTCDIAPVGDPDGIVNLLDLAVIADNWE